MVILYSGQGIQIWHVCRTRLPCSGAFLLLHRFCLGPVLLLLLLALLVILCIELGL